MIAQDKVTIGTTKFIHTYSTDEYYIKQIETDELYSEAYDLIDNLKTYEETDIKIEHIEP